MSDNAALSLPEAAHQLGLSPRVLRQAIRAGRLPAPPHRGATAGVPAGWVASAKSAMEASPERLIRPARQKVAAFARYEGTSAWRKYRVRVRAYADFKAAGQ